ncbi:MAG: type I restriction enzyme HsdR N-terminal domain-containing protein [Bacteroidales bacterium]|jgi:hypothetical protein|nr:type I restriction enzyme HsdR N-terminal domain-containing protein [Bacteroidales bacterium]MCI2121297.1 type I restriction enzyme HsdR N-terminal domain-containing protein [Bacteroidales bacterium]MCI2145213.1 type I restriction enzyme HsdR N-terminal domain-containing protein [Bacteroidales bacterium]
MDIFDPLRRKMVTLTPEEQVRQDTIIALNTEMGVPMSLMMSETAFRFNGLLYRADILVYDRSARPMMLVECKAVEVALGETVKDQVVRYNLALKLPYLMITNGKTTYICELDSGSGEYRFLRSLPQYDEMSARCGARRRPFSL